jgi:non-specific serine/threonine protein kinase
MLGVAGEALWRVSSLSVVDRGSPSTGGDGLVEEVCGSESGRLFIDRARLVAPSFTVTAQNAHAVATVCHRLDGMPLSIELAAARLSMLSIDQIAAHLDQSFRLLTGGNRTAVRRQQTIRATIDWSYQLLSEPERSLLRRLAVFAGGWCLEAAEVLGAGAAQPEEDVFELLSHLVAKSMVQVDKPPETRPTTVRYRLLETIRQYAEEKLVEAGEANLARTRHRDWFLSFAEQAMEEMEGADQKLWWDRLDLELDNLRMALTWSASDPGDSTHLLRLAGQLVRFWALHGLAGEGIRWVELALAQSPTTPTSDRAKALDGLGALELFNGHIERACSLLEESVAQARAVGDRRVLTFALLHLSNALRAIGNGERALQLIEEATAISRDEGFASYLAWSLVYAARCLADAGHFESIEPLLLESLSAGRQSGAITSMIASTGALAQLHMMRGDLSRARRTVDEAIALASHVGIPMPTVSLLITRGDIATAERDWQSASHWYRQALRTATLAGARGIVAVALRHYAALCVALGEPARAARIFGATASIRKAPLLIHIPMVDEDVIATARRALGDDEFKIAWAEGQAMALEQVLTEVEDVPQSLRERAGVSSRAITSNGLTPREREVVVMLAAGRSNRDIAEGLVITEGTVEVHVKRILSKLGLRSRSQVAAWIAEQNLNGAT